jgi:nitrate reductase gamma subunit
MTFCLYGALLFGSAFFVVASLVRAVQYARLPLHLRWELYPVPHEGKRARHGGSYFESAEWFAKVRHSSLLTELRFMTVEIVFLKALREFNRSLWWRSFPFHFGLYLLGTSCAVMLAATLASLVAPGLANSPAFLAAHWAYVAAGVAGTCLTLVGAGGLLHRRLTDPALRPSTTAGDLANLVFFLVALGLTGVGYVIRPSGAAGPVAILRGLLTWDQSLRVPGLLGIGLIASSLLVAYIPLTHMSHFVAKYFTYHQVRWDDATSHANPSLQARMAEYLTYRPTWSAPHVMADGRRTWGELASLNPAQRPKK